MYKHSLPSIEQFAAFLDDNLSQSEMQQFSQLSEHDNALHQLLDASSVVDNTLAGFTDSDLQLPPEIVGSDFELPTIPAEGISPLVTLSPEPMDDMFVAAAACADEDISMFSEDYYNLIDDNLHDESSTVGGFHDQEELQNNNSIEDFFLHEPSEKIFDNDFLNVNQTTNEENDGFLSQEDAEDLI